MKKSAFSKKHQMLISSIVREYDLIDNCKYLIYLNEGVYFAGEEYLSLPVINLKDAKELLNSCTKA